VNVVFEAMGLSIAVTCRSAALADRIAEEWAWCGARVRAPGANDGQVATFEVAGDERSRYALASAVTMRVIGHLGGQRLMLHAAGLANDDGVVVVVIGRSGAGKTTAALALCQEAFGYVSDELVAISESGTVQAYPKPLSQITVDETGEHKQQTSPDALSLRRPPTVLSAGPFVILDRQPAVHTPTLTRLTLTEAVLAVIPQTSYLSEMDRPLQRLCGHLSRWGAYRLRYTDVSTTAGLLSSLSEAPRPDHWTPVHVDNDLFAVWDGRYRRRPVRDAVAVEDEVLLLIERTPMRIAGIGRTVWEALAGGPATADELLRISVEKHGEHPSAAALVQQASTSMVAAGALDRALPQTLDDVMAGRSGDHANGADAAGAPSPGG